MIQDSGSDRTFAGSYKRLVLAALVAGLVVVVPAQRAAAMWTPPAVLNTNAATDSGEDYWPQVTTDGAGTWVAVWGSGDDLGGTLSDNWDVLVSRSTDNGATWTSPAALNTNAATDSGHDSRPQVTTDGAGNWVAVWYSTDTLGGTIGTDRDILVSRSTDNGATWTAPAALNTNAGSDSGHDYGPQVITDGAGNWVAVWDSRENLGGTIGTEGDILVSRLTNNGEAWTTVQPLNTNAATDSGGDYEPQVTTDGAGNWVAVWQSRDTLGGTFSGTGFNIVVSRSTDNGATWTAPAALNTNAATDSGSNVRPQVTTDGAGNWVAAWESNATIGTDYDILVSRSEFNWNEDADGDGTINIDDDDIDGDGISNDDEGTGDPDNDTIPNYLDTDSDDDGMSDGFEVDYGFDPVDDDEMGDDGATGPDGTSDGENDWDGDGCSNQGEEQGATDPTDAESVPVPVAGVFALLVLALALCVIGLKRRWKENV